MTPIEPMSSPIPVVRSLSLFRSGVGYISRQGMATGNFTLPMPSASVNDVLASLTTSGQIRGVSFLTEKGRQEEIERRGFSRNGSDILQGLFLGKLRGQRVTASVIFHDEEGDEKLSDVTGDVLGVDVEQEGEGASRFVTLMTEGGFRRLNFHELHSVQALDPKVNEDIAFWTGSIKVRQGLQALEVQVTAPGEVVLSYLTPAPQWRMKYDLVLNGDEAVLTPWAVVYNPLDEALSNIDLTLATGRPVSFSTTLDTPAHTERSVLAEDLTVDAPTQYSATRSASRRNESTKGMMRTMSAMGAESYQDDVGTMESLGGSMAAPVAVAASFSPSATQADVGSGGTGEDTEFTVRNVTMPPNGAVTLPLTRAKYAAKLLRVWRQGGSPNPEQAIRVQNGDIVLERGPVAITVGGKFVGQAVVPPTPRGREFLLAFAKDTAITVALDGVGQQSTINRIGAGDRGDHLVTVLKQVTRYEIQVQSQHDKVVDLVVEIGRANNMTLEAPEGVTVETVPGFWRLSFTAAPAETKILVGLVQERTQSLYIQNITQEALVGWDKTLITDAQRKVLEVATAQQATLNRANQEVNRIRTALLEKDRMENGIIGKLKELGASHAPQVKDRLNADLEVVGRAIATLRKEEETAIAVQKAQIEMWEGTVQRVTETFKK